MKKLMILGISSLILFSFVKVHAQTAPPYIPHEPTGCPYADGIAKDDAKCVAPTPKAVEPPVQPATTVEEPTISLTPMEGK